MDFFMCRSCNRDGKNSGESFCCARVLGKNVRTHLEKRLLTYTFFPLQLILAQFTVKAARLAQRRE